MSIFHKAPMIYTILIRENGEIFKTLVHALEK